MRTADIRAALEVAAERDALAVALGAICVAATRSILAERDQLHSWHEDEKNWRVEAEKERDALQLAVGALAHHVGVGDGDDSSDPYVEALARLKARQRCGASPYGVHRCVHCDSEVT